VAHRLSFVQAREGGDEGAWRGGSSVRWVAALRRPREEDDAGGGPSWAQSKNGSEDLIGHHGEVG
jgi:hypothetical protein